MFCLNRRMTQEKINSQYQDSFQKFSWWISQASAHKLAIRVVPPPSEWELVEKLQAIFTSFFNNRNTNVNTNLIGAQEYRAMNVHTPLSSITKWFGRLRTAKFPFTEAKTDGSLKFYHWLYCFQCRYLWRATPVLLWKITCAHFRRFSTVDKFYISDLLLRKQGVVI